MSYALPTAPVFNVGSSSGGSGSSDSSELVLPFAYGDATPALIGIAPADKEILSVHIFITEVFNGASPALSVGITGTPADLMNSSENNPAADSEYSVYPRKSYGVDTALYLTIVPGAGASAGTGIVLIKLQP